MARRADNKRKLNSIGLVCELLRWLLLVSTVPFSIWAQNTPPTEVTKAHPWTTSTLDKTERKVTGVIREVTSQHGTTQLTIDGPSGAVTTDLGPYARGAAKNLAPGDHVDVSGWLRTSNGHRVLVVRQIVVGEQQITIRNERAIPGHPAPAARNKPWSAGASSTGGAQ